MFWGLIMEPERRYTQQVKKAFHISMAALDLGSSDNEPSQVMCGYEGRNYLLCTLKQPDMLQCTLDLEFAAGTEVSFASNGKAHIHLTGYLTDVDDGLNLEDLAEEEEDEEDVEEEEEARGKKKKLKSLDKIEPPSKKTKLLNGSAKVNDEDDEEEESDDPDFDEEGEEEADDEEGEEEEDNDEDEDENEEEADEEQEVQTKLSKKDKKKLKQLQEAELEQKKTKKDQPQKKQKETLKGGVVIEDLTEGNGPPAKSGRFVTVYYEGRLERSNKMFDSTSKGPGFKFRLGAGEVIKAWDTGIVGMKVGGIRKVTCPPHTAYGTKGSPPAIPPNSTLVFTVTLKKVN